jgi:hypothetical protein
MAKKFRVTYSSKEAAKALNGGSNAWKAAAIMRQEYAKVVSEAHRKALNSFKRHAVTREIKAGPYSNNKSASLGYGNLFSFIGFNAENDDPIPPVQAFFEKVFEYSVRKRNIFGGYRITIKIPDIDEIRAATPVPWAPAFSWIDGVEGGMPNFGRYLYGGTGVKFKNSESGPGLQLPGNGTSLSPTDYVSKIIERIKYNLEQKI